MTADVNEVNMVTITDLENLSAYLHSGPPGLSDADRERARQEAKPYVKWAQQEADDAIKMAANLEGDVQTRAHRVEMGLTNLNRHARLLGIGLTELMLPRFHEDIDGREACAIVWVILVELKAHPLFADRPDRLVEAWQSSERHGWELGSRMCCAIAECEEWFSGAPSRFPNLGDTLNAAQKFVLDGPKGLSAAGRLKAMGDAKHFLPEAMKLADRYLRMRDELQSSGDDCDCLASGFGWNFFADVILENFRDEMDVLATRGVWWAILLALISHPFFADNPKDLLDFWSEVEYRMAPPWWLNAPVQ